MIDIKTAQKSGWLSFMYPRLKLSRMEKILLTTYIEENYGAKYKRLYYCL